MEGWIYDRTIIMHGSMLLFLISHNYSIGLLLFSNSRKIVFRNYKHPGTGTESGELSTVSILSGNDECDHKITKKIARNSEEIYWMSRKQM